MRQTAYHRVGTPIRPEMAGGPDRIEPIPPAARRSELTGPPYHCDPADRPASSAPEFIGPVFGPRGEGCADSFGPQRGSSSWRS